MCPVSKSVFLPDKPECSRPGTWKTKAESKSIELFHRLDEHFSPQYQGMYDSKDIYTAYHDATKLPVRSLPEEIAKDVAAYSGEYEWLAEVGYGEWRQRLWMVQKQLLNQNLVLLRGSRILSWDAVAAMNFLFYLKLIPRSYAFDFWEKPHGSSAVPPVVKWRSPWDMTASVFSVWWPRYGAARGAEPHTLLHNIFIYEHLECRDVRDRIYAVLAISSDVDSLEIAPDYQKDLGVTFHQLSMKLVSTYDNLEPLYVASCWNNLSNPAIPSWALHQPYPSRLRPHSVPDSPLNHAHPRSAFVSSIARPRFAQDASVMVLKGRHIDKVALSTPRVYFNKSAHMGVCDQAIAEDFTKLLGACSSLLLQLGLTLKNTCSVGRMLIQCPPAATGTRSDVEEVHGVSLLVLFSTYQLCHQGPV